MPRKNVIMYTDGACSGNPGPGGWGVLLISGNHRKELSGGEKHTTNNRMEMQAIVEGFKALKMPCNVSVHSDSALIINAFTKGWITNWIQKGWKKADKKSVENQDLWQEMLEVIRIHQVSWIKVKGHSTDVLNNRVDELAVAASKMIQARP